MYFLDRFREILVVVPLFFLSLTLAQDNVFQTLYSLDVYSSQKPCVQQCFIDTGLGCAVDGIARAIGCEYNACGSKASNNCYCRTDLQPVAESYITSCVKHGCTVGDSSIDISSAGSIYNYYCSSLGFPVNIVATTTQKVAGTSFVTSPAVISSAAAPTATATSSLIIPTTTLSSSELPLPSSSTSISSSTIASTSTTTSTPGTPISTPTSAQASSTTAGAIAGGIVGAIAGLAIIVAILFFLIRAWRRREGGHITALSPMSVENSQMQQQPPYEPQQQYADRHVQPTELTATGPFGSPAPTYSSKAQPPTDAKASTEVYGTGLSLPTSPVRHAYEVSGETWKD